MPAGLVLMVDGVQSGTAGLTAPIPMDVMESGDHTRWVDLDGKRQMLGDSYSQNINEFEWNDEIVSARHSPKWHATTRAESFVHQHPWI